MDWKYYEQVTKDIYETLGQKVGVQIVCSGKDCKVIGLSGVKHQVDVLTEHNDGIHTYSTIIECKYWNQKINKDLVMKVDSIVEDHRSSKGVIVSKIGFTPDAISFAKFKNIGLVELREIADSDWDGRLRKIVFEPTIYFPKITKLQLILTDPSIKPELDCPIEFLEIVTDKDIIPVQNVVKDFTKKMAEINSEEPFEKLYPFQGSTVRNTLTGKEIPFGGIKIQGYIVKNNMDPLVVDGSDQVYLIMKSIFEKKTHAISRDGSIQEWKD